MGGIQLFSIGILGMYLGQIFEQVKNRPPYIIEKLLVKFKFCLLIYCIHIDN